MTGNDAGASGQLAIVAYRALVGGVASGKLDFQVRWFAEGTAKSVESFLRSEPATTYQNSDNEVVSWELVGVLAIESFDPRKTTELGDEVIGFIASTEELSQLADPDGTGP